MRICTTLLFVCGLLGAAVDARASERYLLQPGDILTVSVWKEADLTGELLVRPDGGISLPLAGDIDAAGHTTEEVRATIHDRLHELIPAATVTVAVKATTGNQIFVIGKVARPGQYLMNRPLDIMQALSLAGGATPFAAVNDIHVLRREADKQQAISFHYTDVESGRHPEQNIVLKAGDTVVVP